MSFGRRDRRGDLAYGRSLAVLNNDTYQFLFDLADNQYTLEYSGSNPALATLPPNPFHASQDSATQFVVRLAKLPRLGAPVSLYDVQELTPSPVEATSVQFGPLGATTPNAANRHLANGGNRHRERYHLDDNQSRDRLDDGRHAFKASATGAPARQPVPQHRTTSRMHAPYDARPSNSIANTVVYP